MADALDSGAVADETRRADLLRRSVDVACALLRQARLTREEALAVVAVTRERALELFPGKQDVFDLVLAPRFARILDELCGAPERPVQGEGSRRSAAQRAGTPSARMRHTFRRKGE